MTSSTPGVLVDGGQGHCLRGGARGRLALPSFPCPVCAECSSGEVWWVALGHQDSLIPWGMGTGKTAKD